MECIYKCAPNFYLICIEHFQLNQEQKKGLPLYSFGGEGALPSGEGG